MAQKVKHLPAMQENCVRSLDREDPLEKEMATHFSILVWKILQGHKECEHARMYLLCAENSYHALEVKR